MAEEVVGFIAMLLAALLLLDAFYLGWVIPVDPPIMEQIKNAMGIVLVQ